jgi:hypothetical protein
MKKPKSKKYILKILEQDPLDKNSMKVELTEIEDENKGVSESEQELIQKLAEEFREDSKYDEPF